MSTSTTTTPGKAASALAGITAAAFGLGIAELVAGVSSSLRSPILDVGDRFIDIVPPWLKDIAIDLFGTKDKIALLAGIASVLVVYAAALGVVGLRRRISVAYVGVALFAVAGSAAALLARSGSSVADVVPSFAGALAAGGAFAMLKRQTTTATTSATTSAAADVDTAGSLADSRRGFLGTAAVAAIGGGLAAVGGNRLNARFNAGDSRSAVDLAAELEPLAPIPATAQAPGAASFMTSNADFYRIDTALTVPQVRTEDWTLRVHGMVDNEITLNFEDLVGRGLIERDITMTCVSNTIGGELVGTARWQGVRLDDLLNEAGIDPAATQIVGRSVDGYTCGFPVSTLDGRDALIAVGMNGVPLPLEHGFPARLIVPGLYGYVSATKWLTELELTTFEAFDHYWVPRGYSAEAPIKMQSRIDSPRGLDRIDAGPFVIGGVAWAQTIGIEAVEVKIDEGEWMPATMADAVTDDTWRQWSMPWEATPGRHSIEVRGISRDGAIQTSDRSEPLPDGASGHHTVVVIVNEA